VSCSVKGGGCWRWLSWRALLPTLSKHLHHRSCTECPCMYVNLSVSVLETGGGIRRRSVPKQLPRIDMQGVSCLDGHRVADIYPRHQNRILYPVQRTYRPDRHPLLPASIHVPRPPSAPQYISPSWPDRPGLRTDTSACDPVPGCSGPPAGPPADPHRPSIACSAGPDAGLWPVDGCSGGRCTVTAW
jgi:hypothetical protein